MDCWRESVERDANRHLPPIPYPDEGKKIGWRDGVEALWTLVYFRFLDRTPIRRLDLDALGGDFVPGPARPALDESHPVGRG